MKWKMTTELETRFWPKVSPNGNGCWQWMGAKNDVGYGQIWNIKTKKIMYAHRVCFEMAFGPIPAGLTIDHLCRNPSCVNPYHLDPVTHRVNSLRGTSVSAKNAAKTHCIHGHAFDEKNTRIRSDNKTRICRKCHVQRNAKSIRRKLYESRMGK